MENKREFYRPMTFTCIKSYMIPEFYSIKDTLNSIVHITIPDIHTVTEHFVGTHVQNAILLF